MILDLLYSLVIIVNIIAYMPQILELWRTKSDCRNFDLRTWFLWIGTSAISLAYAVYRVNDLKFALVSSANLIGIGAIIALTLRNRVVNRTPSP
jgi:PQ loop repeat